MFGTSSSSQYLHPDYISPLPTTLDAKNSPLALLAQTCSSIGHDLGPTKHSSDKKSSKENQRSASSASTTSSSVDEKKPSDDKTRTSGSSAGDRHASKGSAVHCNGKITSGGNCGSKIGSKSSSSMPQRKDVLSPTSTTREANSSADKHGSSRSSSSVGQSGSARDRDRDRTGGGSPLGETGTYSASSHSRNERRSTSPVKHQSNSSVSALRNSSPSTIPPTFTGAVPPLLYPPPGTLPQLPGAYPFPFDLFSYSAAVAAAQNAAAAAAAVSGKLPPSIISSYLAGYPRTPSEVQTNPIESCKDPYCSHCTMTSRPGDEDRPCPHLGSSCPQCNRSKSIGAASTVSSGAPVITPHAASAATLSGLPSLYPGASLLYPGGPFGPLLPGSMLGSLPAYVCPVMLPGIQEVCGKRCSSSEEFIQHIRTHTPPFADPGVLGGSAYPSASQLALSSLSQRRSFYPLLDSLGPASSSLRPSPYSHPSAGHSSLLSSRFHPYKSPLSSTDLTSGLSSYAATAQALEAYRTLHAQRAMGAIAP